jgi:hypothetical protein
MLAKLAAGAADEPALGLAKPHFFSFGGADRTAAYVRSLASTKG